MAIPEHISDYLDTHQVPYQHLVHKQEFVAPRVAERLQMSGRSYAKTVVVLVDSSPLMAVIPANARLDLEQVASLTAAPRARLASEDELADLFPGCELGAMPALGNLYELPVWLDASFQDHPTLAFDAGTHVDTIRMSTADFQRLTGARIATLTVRPDA